MANEKFSFKDFTDQQFTQLSASEFNNSEIVGSCFYQQVAPNTQVFPSGITGVTFQGCNLDNVFVPPGNTTEDCSQRKMVRQNDLEDWLVDDAHNPIEPRSKKEYQRLGISTDPKDIPVAKLNKPITEIKMMDIKQADIDALKTWNPEIARRLGY